MGYTVNPVYSPMEMFTKCLDHPWPLTPLKWVFIHIVHANIYFPNKTKIFYDLLLEFFKNLLNNLNFKLSLKLFKTAQLRLK